MYHEISQIDKLAEVIRCHPTNKQPHHSSHFSPPSIPSSSQHNTYRVHPSTSIHPTPVYRYIYLSINQSINMSSLTTFTTALTAAQSGQYTAKIQSAASGLSVDTLKAAVDAVLAGDDNASVEGDLAAALKSGFEFAVELVMALESDPGMEKLEVRLFFFLSFFFCFYFGLACFWMVMLMLLEYSFTSTSNRRGTRNLLSRVFIRWRYVC